MRKTGISGHKDYTKKAHLYEAIYGAITDADIFERDIDDMESIYQFLSDFLFKKGLPRVCFDAQYFSDESFIRAYLIVSIKNKYYSLTINSEVPYWYSDDDGERRCTEMLTNLYLEAIGIVNEFENPSGDFTFFGH